MSSVAISCHVTSKRLQEVLEVEVFLQISREELETAMSFLGDQLGEDELRMLLEKLNAYGESDEGPINVSNLMALATPDGLKASTSAEAQTRGSLADLSHKVNS